VAQDRHQFRFRFKDNKALDRETGFEYSAGQSASAGAKFENPTGAVQIGEACHGGSKMPAARADSGNMQRLL
jgi:hypothetical protein